MGEYEAVVTPRGDLPENKESIAKALEESEARFRRVVESAPSAMVMIGTSGLIEMVNAQTERMFGYHRDELIGQPIELLVPERFRDKHPGLRAAFYDNPKSRSMGAGRDLYGLRKDGSEFPVEIGLNPIEMEEGLMVLSAIVDMTSYQRMQERFRLVVEAAPNGIVVVDQRGIIEMVNSQAEAMFGYERKDMVGRHVDMLVPERFRDHHPALRTSFFDNPQSRPMGAGRDLYAMRSDGSEFPVEIGLNPIETEGGLHVLSAIVDISDRKIREERIQDALEEKDVLLAEIHHRVKNNLQIVSSLLDLQAGQTLDPVTVDMLRVSQNRVKSMALIHQILYQSQDFASIDFQGFLETLVQSLMTSYGIGDRLRVRIEAENASLPLNAAIPCGLIVNELVSNTMKHAFPDGREGEIRIAMESGAPGTMILTVEDNGVGIPEVTDIENGETLGMQLVALLADQLQGTLDVQRTNPTRFTLIFPPEADEE